MFIVKLPKVKGEGKKMNRTVEAIEDGMFNTLQPDLFAVNGDVKFHQYVAEINGAKTILYDATIYCTAEEFIELRIKLGAKGYVTAAKNN